MLISLSQTYNKSYTQGFVETCVFNWVRQANAMVLVEVSGTFIVDGIRDDFRMVGNDIAGITGTTTVNQIRTAIGNFVRPLMEAKVS